MHSGFRIVSLVTYFVALSGSLVGVVSSAEGPPPAFVAEGTVSVELQSPFDGSKYGREEAAFQLYYTNAWWQVDVNYRNAQERRPIRQSTMKIPDGTRKFTVFQGSQEAATTVAEVCPTSFPPPGLKLMFTAWLALCPNPELPLHSGQRGRRFLDIPTCRLNLINDPRNHGDYIISYLKPDGWFLSELTLSNNGWSLDIGQTNEDSVTRYPSPFDEGFVELAHRVIETTNVGGFTFPLKTVSKHFKPKPNGLSKNDTYAWVSTELVLHRVVFSETAIASRSPAPKRLVALDARAANLPKDKTVDYIVSNDNWKPITDPQLSYLVQLAKQPQPKQYGSKSRFWVWIVLAIIVVAPGALLISKSKPE